MFTTPEKVSDGSDFRFEELLKISAAVIVRIPEWILITCIFYKISPFFFRCIPLSRQEASSRPLSTVSET